MASLRRSFIGARSAFSTGHSDLNILIDGFKQMKDSYKLFFKYQETTMKDLLRLAQKEENEMLAQTCRYIEELNIQWCEAQKEFVDNMRKVKCQFSCILKDECELDKLKEKLHSLEKEETKLNKRIAHPKVTITEKHQCQVHLVELKETKSTVTTDLKENKKKCQLTKSKRIRDALKQYSESFLHLSNKCSIIFQSVYKAAVHLPDPTAYTTSDQTSRNLELTRVSVLETKDKIAGYNRLPFPTSDVMNVSGFESPPPYSPNNSFTSSNHNSFTSSSNQSNHSSYLSSSPANPPIGFPQYDQVAPDMIRNLNINLAVPSSACYQNLPTSPYEEQGAVGGHF